MGVGLGHAQIFRITLNCRLLNLGIFKGVGYLGPTQILYIMLLSLTNVRKVWIFLGISQWQGGRQIIYIVLKEGSTEGGLCQV